MSSVLAAATTQNHCSRTSLLLRPKPLTNVGSSWHSICRAPQSPFLFSCRNGHTEQQHFIIVFPKVFFVQYFRNRHHQRLPYSYCHCHRRRHRCRTILLFPYFSFFFFFFLWLSSLLSLMYAVECSRRATERREHQ